MDYKKEKEEITKEFEANKKKMEDYEVAIKQLGERNLVLQGNFQIYDRLENLVKEKVAKAKGKKK